MQDCYSEAQRLASTPLFHVFFVGFEVLNFSSPITLGIAGGSSGWDLTHDSVDGMDSSITSKRNMSEVVVVACKEKLHDGQGAKN